MTISKLYFIIFSFSLLPTTTFCPVEELYSEAQETGQPVTSVAKSFWQRAQEKATSIFKKPKPIEMPRSESWDIVSEPEKEGIKEQEEGDFVKLYSSKEHL